MSAVLSTLQRLEEYVALAGRPATYPLWEMALTKLISHESARLREQKTRLQTQLTDFERQYGMSSRAFYPRFERGEMGDEMDFIEWAATYEMVRNLDRYLRILN